MFQEPIIIAGAAHIGRRFVAELRKVGVKPACFADNRVTGVVDEVPVLTPSEAHARYPDATVLVASLLAEFVLREEMRALGFPRVFTLSELHYRDPQTFWCQYLDGAWESWRDAPSIDWADDESRRVYATILEYRRTRDVGVFSTICDTHPQYFPPGLVEIDDKDVIADCGAYDGDTFRAMRAAFPRSVPAYYAFEPDPTNYERLVTCAKGYPGSFVAIQAGVGARQGSMPFDAGGGTVSSFTPDGALTLPVETLDGFFASRQPATFVKMDIEGMEPSALLGASRLIRDDTPTLAVCVYHAPDHLWELPKLVRGLHADYRLYLRHYSTSVLETVLYAVA